MCLVFFHVEVPVFLNFKFDYKSMRKAILDDSRISRKEIRDAKASYTIKSKLESLKGSTTTYLESFRAIVSAPRCRLDVRFITRRMDSLILKT